MKLKILERCPNCKRKNLTIRIYFGGKIHECQCGYFMCWKNRTLVDTKDDSNTVTH